ncbi:nickel pincer cofactor biosynthesis protein LarC [Neosynechococcus sphagnicola]|uniref:nickel pincer cofactor biosynthesis protein LarC n=1 Tax=Neosynechococcus sphagnicola TaxID=1501145 RepID=UPI0023BAC514|nr:nickel pincer cofactor biosynthesis protein LarC [Neosynechococcus sphagnicola]
MTKLAYFECPTGIAGDMCLGALVHAGVPLEYLIAQLSSLGITDEYHLWAERVHRNGQEATKVHVDLTPGADHADHLGAVHDSPLPHARHLPEIAAIIRRAHLPPRAEAWSLEVFDQLAAAEGAVHGIAPEKVHFHEVGATDAIVDIVGTCLGLDWLGIDQIYCSALPTGGGTVKAAHGQLPVPTPAVLKLWEMRQVPVYSNGIARELVTPTGAAIATTLAISFGSPPGMALQTLGLGAGSHSLSLPNILRLWIGNPCEGSATLAPDTETIAVLATQIDDLSPQAIAYACEHLFAAGAVDVFSQAIAMKKSRMGVLLTVICPPEQITACETVLFQETSTLGIRRSLQQRRVLQRSIQTVETAYGKVGIKTCWHCYGCDGRRLVGDHHQRAA